MPQTFSTPTRRLLILCGALAIAATAAPAHAQPTLSKVFTPDTIGPGSVSTITFTITNGSASPVTGLSFTDTLPTVPGDVDIADPANASTTCDLGVSGSLTAPDGGGTITLSDAQIGGSSSCTVTVDVTANTAGVHTNPAITLSSSAGSSMSLPIDLTVDTDLPGFSKSFAPSSVALGEKSTLTFLIDNTANASNVDNLDFTDNLPAGMEIADPANASTTCGTATIPPTLTAAAGTSVIILDADGIGSFPAVEDGTTCTVTVDVVTTGAGELDNVTSELLADFVSAGKASDTLEVTVTALAIQKEFTDDPVPPGGTATLELRIDNFDRDFPATGVAFTDDLTTLVPALPGLTFTGVLFDDCLGTTSIGGGGTILSLSGGTIAAEGFCTIRVSLSVPAGATPGSYTNTTGTVSATVDGSPVVGNTASDDLFVEPVPLLTKEFLEVGTFNPDPVVNPGDDVILQFTVTNTSTTSAATDVAFDDELTDAGPGTGFLPFPISVTLPPVPDPPCGGGSSLTLYSPDTDRQGLRLTGGSLTAAPGAGATCSFYVTLTIPVDLGPGIYTNTTEEPTATVDAATRTGEVASDTLTVVAAPSLSKEFTDDPVAPGGTVTLELTLSYSPDASGDATGITFTDDVGGATGTLPGLAAAAGELPMIGLCPAGDGMLSGSAGDTLLTFSGATLMPGEECTFSVTLDVPAGAAPGTYPNATSGVAATVDGVAATSAPAEDDLKVAGLVFTKEFLGDPVIAGDTVTLRFTIDNVHPTDDADIILFTDNLGDGGGTLSGLAATGPPSVNTCGGTLSGTTSLTYLGGAGSPDVASEDDCTIEVELLVPAGAADGTYNNTTSSLIASQGGVVIIDPAVDDLTVNSNLLQLSKAFIDDPVAPGDTVTLELTLTNLDTSAASMIDFTDDFGTELPGVTFDSEDFNDCGAAVAGLGTDMISVTGASLGIGGTCALRFTLTVPPGADAGIYTNTTSDVSGDIGGFAVTGDAASDDLEVIQLLLFSKSFDGPTTATGTAMLTFTITNPGTDTASDIAFTDNLDDVISGLIATSLPAVPCGAGSEITGIGFLTFSGGELPPMGGMCSFAVEVLVPASATAGTYPNITSDLFQAGLEVADPATADLVIEPPPTFAKVFSPDAILAGGTSTLTFTIDNSASALAASSLDFTDNLPAGVVVATPSNASTTCTGGTITALSGSGTISYSGGSVAAGAMCTIDVDVTSIATGAHVNVTGDLTSTSGNSGTATDTLTVSPAADLSVTKTDGVTSATPGGSVTYTIVVTNPGPSADPSVGLADVFPAELTCTYTSVAAGGATGNTAAGAGDIADTLSMPAGSSVTYTADCTIAEDATGTLSNTATVAGSVTDPDPGNNSATDDDTVLVPDADLGVVKEGPATVTVGEQLTYTLTITNDGPSTATMVSVDDPTPTGLTFISATAPCAGGFPCDLGTMSAGDQIIVDVTFEVPFDYAGPDPIVNTATVSSDVADGVPGNDSDTAETDVVFDVVPPEVTGVATNAGPLAECDTVREPVTVIEVTIEDDQSPIENAGAASSYLLVEAGPDRDFSTADCTGPAGDDAQVTIASVTLIDTPPTALAQLNFGAVGLGAGLYRLLVCDAITDAAGNALDGDGDAAPGGDFVLSFFRADPLNLFENGHFDDCPVTLDPWLIVATAPNTVTPGTPGTDDHEASPLSASARVSHSTAAPSTLAQCVDVEVGVVYDLSARWRFDPPMGAQGLLEQTCEFFDAAACTGVSLGSTSTATFLEDSGGAWEMIAGEVVAAAGAVSALCDYAVQPAGLDPNFDLYLDALSLTTDGLSSIIFADGFESGDTSAWSSTQP